MARSSISALWFGTLFSWSVARGGTMWESGDPARPEDWDAEANWAGGTVPAADSDGALLLAGCEHYPVLRSDIRVFGDLRIGRGAQLVLQGHEVTLTEASIESGPGAPGRPRGLVVEGLLDAAQPGSRITLEHSGLLCKGVIRGEPAVAIAGKVQGIVLDPGGSTFSTLTLGPSTSPYPVTMTSRLVVTGDVELNGGNLIIAAGQALVIRGNLIFRGRTPGASLTPEGEVELHGNLISEGSARWEAAAAGWVKMAGPEDQHITAGGFLPPLRIEKPAGKVIVSGDLHCPGLWISAGNTLDLSGGQTLILGSPQREWRFDPADRMIVKTYRSWRSSRDLVNRGHLIGAPFVPFLLYVNRDDQACAVRGRYVFQRRPGNGGTGEVLATSGSEEDPTAGDLSIDAPDSRLALRDGQLWLDGRPVSAGRNGEEEDEEDIEDEEETEGEETARGKARLTHLVLEKIAPPVWDRAGLVNVTPLAARIRSVPSIGRSIRNLADGFLETASAFRGGVGGGGTYEFLFARPVTVSGVRFYQGDLFAIRYRIAADTTGDGRMDTILAAESGGSPRAWLEATFKPVGLHALRFQALQGQQGWETAYPQLHEFEIYADAASARFLGWDTALKKTEPADEVLHPLAAGPETRVQWPEVEAKNRILKSVMVDLWMFGVQTEEQIATFQHLRDTAPFQDLIAGLKHLGADTANLFIEADPMAFWPSRNFKSITNKKYFEEMAARSLPPVESTDALVGEPGEEAVAGESDRAFEAEVSGESPKTKKSPEIDPPSKRDLLMEFCEGMHECGLKVTVLFRDEILAAYVGPPGVDAWQTLLEEVAARGVDGVYLMGDEAYFGLANPRGAQLPPDHPERLAFRKRWGPGSDLPRGWESTEDYRKHVLLNYERAAETLRRRRDAVRKIHPGCLTLVNIGSGAITANNRMTYGLAYDILGHIADMDFFGSDYVSGETRTFVAAAKNRRATMVLGAGPAIGEGIRSVLLGARAINYYRYNTIDLWKATEARRREFEFIRRLESWGIAAAQPPKKLACLLSRASEDWWDNKHGTYWLGESPQAKRGFWTSRLVQELLLEHGYPYDLYFLDQVDDLADLGSYRLILVPFPYSISRDAAALLEQAVERGVKLWIAQARGEVNELGTPYDQPLLIPLIERGAGNGRVAFLDRDLVEYETDPNFEVDMCQTLDKLLGPYKPLFFRSRGNPVEAHLVEKEDSWPIVVLINFGKAAEIEIGLNLPEGEYRMFTCSTLTPGVEHEGRLEDQPRVSQAQLRRFAVRLEAGESRAINVMPGASGPGRE